MFQLDEKFLNDIGLNELPEEQKQPFLQHVYEELELRVGTKLSEGLSDQQLAEFESIIDGQPESINGWLNQNNPNYLNDPAFIQIKEAAKLDENDLNLKSEYAATKWLEMNRPDYRQVVAEVLDGLKGEIVNNRSAILG